MKKIVLLASLMLLCSLSFSQSVPSDSLYLCQTTPGISPVIFELPIESTLRPVERIAVSEDGSEIYFGELNTYPPSVMKIKYFKYMNDHWQGPFDLFSGYMAPALSPGDSLMYIQASIDYDHAATYISARTTSGWSSPAKMFGFEQQSHYCQTTTTGNCFISTNFPGSSLRDLGRVVAGTDTTVVTLGPPINTTADESDFFIARDESYIIHARHTAAYPGDLYVSYKKSDGGWTNSKPLGGMINISNLWEYGPFVTHDGKYLFFTRGGNSMSTYYTYWVKIDNLLDSLKYTNYVPYVKNPLSDQEAVVSRFFSFNLPDSTFFDDDGDNTLSFMARLSNGDPLPGWLSFDSLGCKFVGTPTETGTLNIRVSATDTAGTSCSDIFKLVIGLPTTNGQIKESSVCIFPNPCKGLFRIRVGEDTSAPVDAEVYDLCGRMVLSGRTENKGIIDLTGKQAGIYFLKVLTSGKVMTAKVFLEE